MKLAMSNRVMHEAIVFAVRMHGRRRPAGFFEGTGVDKITLVIFSLCRHGQTWQAPPSCVKKPIGVNTLAAAKLCRGASQ